MLNLTTCDTRFGRREFLRVGGLSLGGLALPGLLPNLPKPRSGGVGAQTVRCWLSLGRWPSLDSYAATRPLSEHAMR